MSEDKQAAAAARSAAVTALEVEREGYVRRGLDDRVKQVDAELRKIKGVPAARRTKPKDEA